EENLIPPAGLKPVEQEAWLAMARRQEANGGMEFMSFYPARYNEPFVVQGAGARVELVKGEVHFSNKARQGVKIEAPWLIDATGEQRAGAVRWELEESKSGASYRLRLVVAKGLSYPVLIDPSWVPTGSLVAART